MTYHCFLDTPYHAGNIIMHLLIDISGIFFNIYLKQKQIWNCSVYNRRSIYFKMSKSFRIVYLNFRDNITDSRPNTTSKNKIMIIVYGESGMCRIICLPREMPSTMLIIKIPWCYVKIRGWMQSKMNRVNDQEWHVTK